MKGGIVGLRANSRKHPNACKAFASAIRFAAPTYPFTSFSVHADAPTTTHVDRYNADVYNIILPLTRFEGGGIWLQDASGSVLSPEDDRTLGVVADVAAGPCAIDARNRKHTVMPWAGTRIVLVGFAVSAFSKFSSSDAEALASLGFNLDINPFGQSVPACATSGLFDLRSSTRPAATQTFDDNSAVQPLTLCKPPDADNFSSVGKPARLLVIEACCGCARLSATLKKDGFDVLPLDCEGNRHRSLVTVVSLDLRKPASWEFLQTCVLSNRVFHFHGAPPCGTASRARDRDRPMSSAEWGPPPLRSERYPQGFPWLRGTWRDKVESANLIYLQMARFCEWLSSLNISWSVENPERSYMWLLPEWNHLRSQSLDVLFDSCMWGSCRKKSTRFLTTCVEMLSLAKTCDNKHSHASWLPVRNKSGVQYATSQEAAYPHELCQAMSSALQLQAASFNLELVRECPLEQSSHAAAASARRQPKLSKYKPLLEDFKHRVTVAVDSVEHLPLDAKSCLKVALPSVPAGAKLLRKPVKGVGSASGLGPLGLGPSAPASGLGPSSPSAPAHSVSAACGI